MFMHLPGEIEAMFDESGVMRVRVGDLTKEFKMSELYHLTRDGEYEDGVIASKGFHTQDNLAKFRNTYAGCQSWCKSNGEWYSVAAAGIGYARWEGCTEKSVPECVRLAELVR